MALLLLPGPAAGHPDLLAQIEVLDERLLEAPGDAELLLKRADLYRRHGEYGAARRDLGAARQSNPDLPALDFVEGRIDLESGRPEAARLAFDRYLAADPGQAKALKLRAEAWLALGRPADAARDFSQAITSTENPSPALYREQALALLAAGEPHWPEARAAIDAALLRFPLEVSLLGLAADTALAQEDPEAAQTYIGVLPSALRELPQWQARAGLASEMTAADPDQRQAALRQARESLTRQLELMRSVP